MEKQNPLGQLVPPTKSPKESRIPPPANEPTQPVGQDIFSFIKDIRLRISRYQNSISLLEQSREISLVKTNLDRGFAWLGKTMEFLGSTTPYVQSENPDSKAIEPTADITQTTLSQEWVILDNTQTAKVKDFRHRLQDTINNVESIMGSLYINGNGVAGRKPVIAIEQAFISLIDAKMWLGWELGRIKQVSEKMAILSGGAKDYK